MDTQGQKTVQTTEAAMTAAVVMEGGRGRKEEVCG